MKTLILAALVALTPFTQSNTAQAMVEEPIWNCALSFDARGYDIKAIFVGRTKIQGHGVLRCTDIAGNEEDYDVFVKIRSPLLSPRLSLMPRVRINAVSTGIGLATQPSDLFDIYHVVDARAAVGGGVGAAIALQGNRNSVTINLSAEFSRGIGLAVGMSQLEIIPVALR
jgi:hypothetical protein